MMASSGLLASEGMGNSDVVDAVVGGNGEQPSAESVCRSVEVKRAESFSKGFYGKVVGFYSVVGHFQEHEIEGFPVHTHQIGVGTLVAMFACAAYQLIVALRFFGLKLSFYLHLMFFLRNAMRISLPAARQAIATEKEQRLAAVPMPPKMQFERVGMQAGVVCPSIHSSDAWHSGEDVPDAKERMCFWVRRRQSICR